MKKLIGLCLLSIASAWANPPSILNNSDHIAGDLLTNLAVLGIAASGTSGPTSTVLAVNQSCQSGVVGGTGCLNSSGLTQFAPSSAIIANALNTSVVEYQPNSATAVMPSVPYQLINQSSTGYTLAGNDQANYQALESAGIVYVMAYCGTPQVGDYPPVAYVTMLPNTAFQSSGPGVGPQCSYAQGIEFSMTVPYAPLGGGFLTTGSPSDVSEATSTLMAALKYNNPTWTWGDIKGAFRQTASNWGMGYAAAATNGGVIGLGFGNLNYQAALAIPSTSNIYLQAPGMSITQPGGQHYAVITLYPFLTTRRAREVVYIGGTWPAASSVNEMTAAQIAAAGGTKIIDDAGATGVQSFTYAPAASGTATFTAITLDGSGNGSRVEVFSSMTETFLIGTACLQ